MKERLKRLRNLLVIAVLMLILLLPVAVMADLPTGGSLLTGTYTFEGQPFIGGASKSTIDLTTLGYVFDGEPFVVNEILSPPTLTTSAATSVTYNSATGNGNITDTGGENPATRGFCYSTVNNPPTTADSVVNTAGSFSTGAFTQSITGLDAGTLYYVRSYATNSAGTGYGTAVEVTTQEYLDRYTGTQTTLGVMPVLLFLIMILVPVLTSFMGVRNMVLQNVNGYILLAIGMAALAVVLYCYPIVLSAIQNAMDGPA